MVAGDDRIHVRAIAEIGLALAFDTAIPTSFIPRAFDCNCIARERRCGAGQQHLEGVTPGDAHAGMPQVLVSIESARV
jgi:hypothetical protein